jgi:two-component system OmpR family response regulator
MRILLVEDDPIMAMSLMHNLQVHHNVTHEDNGRRADHLLTGQEYELVILDMGLPDMDGSEVLKRLRQRGSTTPVMILTARDKIEERVQGLDSGADYYLAKPVDLPELEARIRALLRRGQTLVSSPVSLGGLSFYKAGQCATVHGQTLDLSSRELQVLEILILRADRLVSRELICEQLSVTGKTVTFNALSVYIHRLRKKILEGQVTIRTVHGVGYVLEQTETAIAYRHEHVTSTR